MLIKPKDLLILTSFKTLQITIPRFNLLSKSLKEYFDNIFLVNTDNLKIKIIKKKNITANYLEHKRKYKIFKFYNPKNILEFQNFIKDKYPLIINNIGRYLEDYSLLRLIAKNKIPQAIISNMGNIQAPEYYFKGKISHRFNNFFQRKFPYFIMTILSNLGFLSKVDIRFISNQKIYQNYLSTNYLKKKMSYFKKYILVDSNLTNEKKKINLSLDYILHLDLDPDYPEITNITGKFNKDKIKKHYIQINKLLEKFQYVFKKKVIVSIHPNYSLKNAKIRFPKFKIINKNVFNYVSKAFLVTAFDSSVITDAIQKNKKILILESLLFKEKKYPTSLYKKILNLKAVEIFNFKNVNKNIYRDLRNKTLNYKNYVDIYIKRPMNVDPNKIIALNLNTIYEKYYDK